MQIQMFSGSQSVLKKKFQNNIEARTVITDLLGARGVGKTMLSQTLLGFRIYFLLKMVRLYILVYSSADFGLQ